MCEPNAGGLVYVCSLTRVQEKNSGFFRGSSRFEIRTRHANKRDLFPHCFF
jgi:hypothetical protein